ncbi:MAG: AIR synthase family protein [Lachnospiraceae bacterium]|nr:AIR synthase family protein [Lachnospiraceae bacterium]
MKIGKVPEKVLKRSILKQIKHNGTDFSDSISGGRDCALFIPGDSKMVALTTDPEISINDDMAYLSVINAVNNLAAAGAEPAGIMLTLLLPEGTEEAVLKKIVSDTVKVCEIFSIELAGGHTEITKAVTAPVFNVTGIGRIPGKSDKRMSGARPEDDIVITKWIGLKGTYLIADRYRKELAARFSQRFIDEALQFKDRLCVLPEAMTASGYGITSMHDASSGGIFAALWELGRIEKKGLTCDLKKIPIRQETVEICEFFGINPYELDAAGSMLFTAENGKELVKALNASGIYASLAGKITDNNDRVIINGEEKRFLEPPSKDELDHMLFEA